MFAVTLLLFYLRVEWMEGLAEGGGGAWGSRHLMSCFLCCLLSFVAAYHYDDDYMLFLMLRHLHITPPSSPASSRFLSRLLIVSASLSLSRCLLHVASCFLHASLFIEHLSIYNDEARDCVVISLFNVFITRTLTRS